MTTIRRGVMVAAVAILMGGCAQEAGKQAEPSASTSSALTQDAVLPTGSTCSGTGAHAKHGFTSCSTCHVCGGVLQFDPAGAAVAAGQPLPAFDAATKTCSNVACHSVPSGTYSYYVIGGDGEPVLTSVQYGGGGAPTTSGWYTVGAACGSCHRMPASPYLWHSGNHAVNTCESCHQNATGFTNTSGVVTDAAIVTTSTCGPYRNEPCPPFHRNGVVDVTPQWNSSCFGCH